MTTHENSRSRPVGEEYRLNGQSLVKKWRVSDSKMIFSKNQELVVLLLKCKPTPVPAKSTIVCTKSKIYDEGSRNKMRDDMRIPCGLLFMLSVVFNFRFRVSVAASQKQPVSALWKWKRHFPWDETEISLHGVCRHPMGHARIRYGLIPTNYAMIRAESSSFDLKVTQPRTWYVISVKGLSDEVCFSRFEFFSRI
jgi:hypothetical protein